MYLHFQIYPLNTPVKTWKIHSPWMWTQQLHVSHLYLVEVSLCHNLSQNSSHNSFGFKNPRLIPHKNNAIARGLERLVWVVWMLRQLQSRQNPGGENQTTKPSWGSSARSRHPDFALQQTMSTRLHQIVLKQNQSVISQTAQGLRLAFAKYPKVLCTR